MSIILFFAFVNAASVSLIAASGYLFGSGHPVWGYILGAIGGGWIAISTIHQLGWIADVDGENQALRTDLGLLQDDYEQVLEDLKRVK